MQFIIFILHSGQRIYNTISKVKGDPLRIAVTKPRHASSPQTRHIFAAGLFTNSHHPWQTYPINLQADFDPRGCTKRHEPIGGSGKGGTEPVHPGVGVVATIVAQPFHFRTAAQSTKEENTSHNICQGGLVIRARPRTKPKASSAEPGQGPSPILKAAVAILWPDCSRNIRPVVNMTTYACV